MMQKLQGIGTGWRPELAWSLASREDLGFVELTLERGRGPLKIPEDVRTLQERGVSVAIHGVDLGLAGAEPPDPLRLQRLTDAALAVDAPLISEHVAFVRAGGLDSGHLLPPPRTRKALDILVDNVRRAQDALPVPLALENIASLFAWPEDELTEIEFLSELFDRTDALWLLDVANVFANAHNFGGDVDGLLRAMPLERIAYVHVAGGVTCDGFYHDTHRHAVGAGVLELLARVGRQTPLPGVMLEMDGGYPGTQTLHATLDAIAAAAFPRNEETAHVG